MGLDEELQELRQKLQETPVNKATETERARLKARIAELEEEQEKRQKETGGGYEGYAVQKTGDATVALVGPPSVGKSTLLNQLTNAESETGDYEFTTLDVVPGMLDVNGASIQLLDVPGLIGGAAGGKGGGRQVLSVVRNADMVLMVASPGKLDGFKKMETELYEAGIRLDVDPPDVTVTKTDGGGLSIGSTVDQTHLDEETIEEVLRERGYVNAKVTLREDVTVDRLVDALSDNRVYMPSLKLVNKVDALSSAERKQIAEAHPDALFVSAAEGTNLDTLQDHIFDALELMRVFMKEPGEDPDEEEPLIVGRGSTVMDVAEALPGEMDARFDTARVWGDSAQFPAQEVGADHVLKDGDTLEIRTR